MRPIIIAGLLSVFFLCVTLYAIHRPSLCVPIEGIDHGSGEPFTVYVGDCK